MCKNLSNINKQTDFYYNEDIYKKILISIINSSVNESEQIEDIYLEEDEGVITKF